MTNHQLPSELLASIDLPRPQLSKLSFCNSAKVAKVEAWAEALLATQFKQTSVLLYKSLPEISLLKTRVDNRLAMLEAVRPTTQNVIQGLTREFLHLPLSSSESAQKTAIIAQALQKSMVDAYTLCVKEFSLQKRINANTVDALSKAIHRAISGIGLIFFRSYQLYTQPPHGLWIQLHALLQIAEYFDVIAKPVLDPLLVNKASNIQCAYIRVLMMATARLNQVAKNEISVLYAAFERWSASVKLSTKISEGDENLFVVNLSQDSSPQYKSRFTGLPDDRVVELNFKALLRQLSNQKSDDDETTSGVNKVTTPGKISESLLDHIIESWSNIPKRLQERHKVEGTADVCLGLVDCHQLAAGGLSFEEFNRMGDLDTESPLNPIANGFTPADKTSNKTTQNGKTNYRVAIQNVSSDGYCLLWKGEAPARLQSGELIGIKEMGKRTWSIGVVRWVRQLRLASQLGIQILAHQPSAAGAAQVYDMGGYSDFMRAFMLSPSKGAQTPISILTAATPFKEYDKVKLYDGDSVTTIKLDKCLFATAASKQFAYRPLESTKTEMPSPQKNAPQNPPPSNDGFDESWDE